ncbi:metabotropic glutamate receptor-like [Teleopsis dalmanni]|uniref:metabotropic glutamate receptor-like n=1 Tax=Teleopsis dalmanni TaxID=139649 RepID=UPI0018CDA4EC|nr:metabotropic glutamate receptor-like [Teleopsis dalmanni]
MWWFTCMSRCLDFLLLNFFVIASEIDIDFAKLIENTSQLNKDNYSTDTLFSYENEYVRLNPYFKRVVNEEQVLNAYGQETISVSFSGDIILGGLFPIHEKGEGAPCGRKIYNRGVHRLEAMLYAVDRVNNDTSLLPGITIGVHILDTCSRDTYALNQSLQFVRASLNNLDTSAFECPDESTPRMRKNASSGPVFGVIGGSYSSVSMQVANLLRLFHIPQISPASTAKTLSDKTRFDLFARTVPPDTFQSVALVDIIKCFNWSYISTVHSEGSYGEYGIEAFHKEASERNVCIAVAEKVPSNADEKVFDAILYKLQKKPNARGVVLFTRAEDARSILMAAKRANLTRPFHWIASDGWGKQQKLLDGLEDIAEGSITVELQSELIEDFDNYMHKLTPYTNQRNPWFREYWEEIFNCALRKTATPSANNSNNLDKFPQSFDKALQNEKPVCMEGYKLSEKYGYEQESKTQFVIDAVYAFAHALHKLHSDLCSSVKNQLNDSMRLPKHHQNKSVWNRSSQTLACPEMINYDGKDFYDNYLLNVSFIGKINFFTYIINFSVAVFHIRKTIVYKLFALNFLHYFNVRLPAICICYNKFVYNISSSVFIIIVHNLFMEQQLDGK